MYFGCRQDKLDVSRSLGQRFPVNANQEMHRGYFMMSFIGGLRSKPSITIAFLGQRARLGAAVKSLSHNPSLPMIRMWRENSGQNLVGPSRSS